MITIGSLFSGIGGFELGLERAIPNSKTIWQCEQDSFCQNVLKKHWPDATIYTDIKKMDAAKIEPVDVLCGGFPCQDISIAGKGEGLNGKKSGLWWEMLRIIGDLQKKPRVIVLENVSAITFRGGIDVVGSVTEMGYDCEWGIISAGGPKGFGAPHLRKRWFLVAYSDRERTQIPIEGKQPVKQVLRSQSENRTFWKTGKTPHPVCSVDDGISQRVAKLRALGNAIVPQCSEYVGKLIWEAGLL